MKPPTNSVQEMWESYSKATMPADASTTQRSEMKIAFMAGAMCILAAQVALHELDEELALKKLQSWFVELASFGQNNATARFDQGAPDGTPR